MKIVIVEDDLTAAEQLEAHLERFAAETGTKFEIGRYGDAESFLRSCGRERPSIVFFDIDLPSINGMEAARRLREWDEAVVIVFVTKMAQYAKDGYAVNALDFLVKPVAYAEFKMKMQRAVNAAGANEVKTLQISVDGGFYRVPADKIVFVEVSGHRLRYQLVDGAVETRGSLSDVEEKLAGRGFLRCNSCYLVNARYIDSVKGYDLYIHGHQLQISHPRRKEFMKQVMDFFTGSLS